MIAHQEYSIIVQAPNDIEPCIRCRKPGDFCFRVKNDKDETVIHVENLCGSCVLISTIEVMVRGIKQ